jgi:hypothetical protein
MIPDHLAEAAAHIQGQISNLEAERREYDSSIAKLKLQLGPLETTRNGLQSRIDNCRVALENLKSAPGKVSPQGFFRQIFGRTPRSTPKPDAEITSIAPVAGSVPKTFVEVILTQNEIEGLTPRQLAEERKRRADAAQSALG